MKPSARPQPVSISCHEPDAREANIAACSISSPPRCLSSACPPSLLACGGLLPPSVTGSGQRLFLWMSSFWWKKNPTPCFLQCESPSLVSSIGRPLPSLSVSFYLVQFFWCGSSLSVAVLCLWRCWMFYIIAFCVGLHLVFHLLCLDLLSVAKKCTHIKVTFRSYSRDGGVRVLPYLLWGRFPSLLPRCHTLKSL